jgi:phage-related protein
MKQLRYTPQFEKEIAKFSDEVKEDIFLLVQRYLSGERLPRTQFKTFDVSKNERIQEFKVKDRTGNWRVISCMVDKASLTFIYAFHKKSQKLLGKDKKLIVKRIKELKNG